MNGTVEQGIVGDSRLLVGIGKKGNITNLFWPGIDFPQHIEASFAGIYTDRTGFGWTTDPPWSYSQRYAGDTAILKTVMNNPAAGIEIKVTDFVPPGDDILVRHFEVANKDNDQIDVRLFYYLDMQIMETLTGNTAYYDTRSDAVIQYYREYYFSCGGDMKMSGYQCGAHMDGSDAFADVYDGRLEGNPLIISHGSEGVNSSQVWDLGTFSHGEKKDITLFLGMGTDENSVLTSLAAAREKGYAGLYNKTEAYWKKWLARGRDVRKFPEVYRRSLITMKLLCDRKWGGIIAAPSVEPNYRFCWTRDGTFIATALDRAGYHKEAEKFYRWCRMAQEKTGGWKQRYFVSPPLAGPSWGPQIDETGVVLSGMGYHYMLTRDKNFLRENWEMIKKTAEYLRDMQETHGINGLMCRCLGLWEERMARHIYSNAACYDGLRAASMIARILGKKRFSGRWKKAAGRIKEGIEKGFWNGDAGHFIKSVDPVDTALDISILGLVVPYNVFSIEDERVRSSVKKIEETFRYRAGGIGRYPSDVYYGGNPWILTTLWLAIYFQRAGEREKGEELARWCTGHATELGMLPEQVHRDTGDPLSAIPLGWSHAMMVHYILECEKRR